ncbi:hypothetical protein ACH3VR_22575 [Microbacterium sp. B2969]|uniref:WxL domain-containing protein n=1 Tax=Microbacterium alkaliflavum TaxID=3248839 RepID=A0ABW7QEJ7_9MICO
MNKKVLIARTAAGALGGLLLLGAAGAAIADELDNGDVDVNVNIEALPPVGALTMTVDSNASTLTESTSADPEVRRFTGTLPTVTVTDDREEVPAGAFWYVTGQASDFAGPGGASITAGHLGWSPRLLTEGNGEVAPGDEVGTVLDPQTDPNNVGVVDNDLLALALDSNDARPTGEWKATADLTLKTDKHVTPGAYSSTLTLTLWEDEF